MSSRLSPPRLAKGSNFKPGTSGRETVLRSKAGLTHVQREHTTHEKGRGTRVDFLLQARYAGGRAIYSTNQK